MTDRLPVLSMKLYSISSIPNGFVEINNGKAYYNYKETFTPEYSRPKHIGRKKYGECYLWKLTDSKGNEVIFFIPNSAYTSSTIIPEFDQVFNIPETTDPSTIRLTLEKIPGKTDNGKWLPVVIEYVEGENKESSTEVDDDFFSDEEEDEETEIEDEASIDQSVHYWEKTIKEYIKKRPETKDKKEVVIRTMQNKERADKLTERYKTNIRTLTDEEAEEIYNRL